MRKKKRVSWPKCAKRRKHKKKCCLLQWQKTIICSSQIKNVEINLFRKNSLWLIVMILKLSLTQSYKTKL